MLAMQGGGPFQSYIGVRMTHANVVADAGRLAHCMRAHCTCSLLDPHTSACNALPHCPHPVRFARATSGAWPKPVRDVQQRPTQCADALSNRTSLATTGAVSTSALGPSWRPGAGAARGVAARLGKFCRGHTHQRTLFGPSEGRTLISYSKHFAWGSSHPPQTEAEAMHARTFCWHMHTRALI